MIAFGLFCYILLIIGIFSKSPFNATYDVVFLWGFLAVYAGTRWIQGLFEKKKDLSFLTFWIFVIVFFVIAGGLQVFSGIYPWGGGYDDLKIVDALLIVILGCIFFDLGYGLSKNVSLFGEWYYFFSRGISHSKLFILVLLTVPISFLILSRLGGLDFILQPRLDASKLEAAQIARESNQGARVLLVSFMRAFPIVSFLCMLYLTAIRERIKFHYPLLFLSFLEVAFFCNPISTPRFLVGSIFVSSVLIWSFHRFPKVVSSFIAFLLFALVTIFPITDIYRNTLDISLSEVLDSYLKDNPLIYKPDYDVFQQVLNTVDFVSMYGYKMFDQIIGVVLFAVPRGIWPTKPMSTGELLADGLGYSFSNLSAPLWAEFYIDAGIFWLCIGMFLYGSYLTYLKKLFYIKGSIGAVIIFFFSAYQIFFLRGSLMITFGYFMPTLLIFFLVSTKKRITV
ncbi:MAG: oligosaccharide repeat unit polymerase [Pseudomonadales bacterium]|nr:oligosaccharide repeat unit polymerase [Pseudomonadales bacterium]